MFAKIGRITIRFRWPIIAIWVTAAVVLIMLAPSKDEVVHNELGMMLPEEAPSVQGEDYIVSHFPDQKPGDAITLIFDAGQSGTIDEPQHTDFMLQVSEWLVSGEVPPGVASIESPSLDSSLAEFLISSDRQVAMVNINLSTDKEKEQRTLLSAIGKQVEDPPEGLTVYRSGSTAMFFDYNDEMIEDGDRTFGITILMVLVMLLLIYRSPVSPFIPLLAVTLAYMIVQGIVFLLADAGTIKMNDTILMILIVIMYGAGTDYCLFLISRFREELADNSRPPAAARTTVRWVGETISSSAGTILVGFLAISFTKLDLFADMGPALIIAIIFGLLTGLTFTPALLSLIGQKTFWPFKAHHRNPGLFYRATSELVTSRPLIAIVVIVAVMVPFSVYGLDGDVTYDWLDDLDSGLESVDGFRVLEDNIGAGNMFPIAVSIDVDKDDPFAEIEAYTQKFAAVDHVVSVYSPTQPLGESHESTAGITRLDQQLGVLSALTSSEATVDAETLTVLRTGIYDYLNMVSEHVPELATLPAMSDSLVAAEKALNSDQLPPELSASLAELAVAAPTYHISPSEFPASISPVFGGDMLVHLVNSYFHEETATARFQVFLDENPTSSTSLDVSDKLHDILANHRGEYGIAGMSALNADLRSYLADDMTFVVISVLIGVFVLLMIMLRSVIAPLYLIGTILLSYTTTLGLTRIASDIFWDLDRLQWYIPFLMFVFLVALGIDYSIFLFGRVKEEVGKSGIHDGIHDAVQNTGPIITSAGIILAGTFAGFLVSNFLGMKQLGFAVAVGILIDTFVVRTMLDPALAAFFGRWTWWPGGVGKSSQAVLSPPEPSPSGAD